MILTNFLEFIYFCYFCSCFTGRSRGRAFDHLESSGTKVMMSGARSIDS